MKKSNSKSIRLSDKVLNYIMSYPVGNGFNEKFENIIIYAMETEEDRKRDLAFWDEQIKSKRDDYYLLCDKLRQLEPWVQGALHVNKRIKELNVQFEECISNCPGVPDSLENNCDTGKVV